MSTVQDSYAVPPSGINSGINTQPTYATGVNTNPTTTTTDQVRGKYNNAAANAQPAMDNAKAKLNSGLANAQGAAQNAAEQIKAHPAVQQAHQSFSQYMYQLDKELSRYPILNQLEQKTQVPKAYGALIAAAFFLSTIFINSAALPMSNLVGFAFPAYFSFRAVESPGHQDDVQWLTYWTIFGFLTFLESMALRVVLYYVPYYFPIKTAFVLWLQLPTTRGAQVFHHSVMKPVVNNLRGKRAAYAQPSTNPFPTNTPYTTTTTTSNVAYEEKVL